jgi:hypothetical protein
MYAGVNTEIQIGQLQMGVILCMMPSHANLLYCFPEDHIGHGADVWGYGIQPEVAPDWHGQPDELLAVGLRPTVVVIIVRTWATWRCCGDEWPMLTASCLSLH